MPIETDQRQFFRQVASLSKQGDTEGSLRLLGGAVRAGGLDAEGWERAGRLIAGLLAREPDRVPGIRATLLGQCTTSWLANTLIACAWGRGCALHVKQGEYDNVIQELMTPASEADRPQIVILVPWTQRLLSGATNRSAAQRLNDELQFWKNVWDLARDRMGARILQVGYDWISPGPLGHHLSCHSDGAVGLVRRLNDELRNALPKGSFFLDLEQVSGMAGRENFYDSRRYFWTKQPFSESGGRLLAAHLWAGVRALMSGPQKVLVLDLDNTLWGGVVGETGPLRIGIGETPDGEAFRAFQKHVKALGEQGVVLTVCSKNNPEDALAPFQENPQMVLGLADFAHIEASWNPKSEGLRRIAETLNLGLDSFVFFDDNPAEREEIRQALPEVEVVEVPPDPSDYIGALSAGLWFEAVELSKADWQRSQQYQLEKQRRELEKSYSSMDEYLASLEMQASIWEVDETCMDRVVQLLAKTNQFNLTTRRHSRADVEKLLGQSGSIGIAMSLADRFGEHGLVSVLLAIPEATVSDCTLRIDTWLMSCRVIGRTVEQFLFNRLLARAQAAGYQSLSGQFIPTRKNALVADLFDRLGFTQYGVLTDGSVEYRLALESAVAAATFVGSASSCAATSY